MERVKLGTERVRLDNGRQRLAIPVVRQQLPIPVPSPQIDLYGFKPVYTSEADLFSSGCMLLDLANGGGFREGRIVNVVGDKSTGKTLLCIEAAANFIKKHPNGLVRYRETEAAFDTHYAESLGLPMDRVQFIRAFTIEDWFKDLETYTKTCKQPTLDITDSLDALSDVAELDRDMTEGSYDLSKPKKLGQLFRRLVQNLEAKNISLLIVSQTRDKIGVAFGDKQTRSGGKALDFYASQIVWLSHLGQIKRTKGGVDRIVGVRVRAKNKKCKIGPPFREAGFDIFFGYGIDSVGASLDWLVEVKKESVLGTSAKEYYKWMNSLSADAYFEQEAKLNEIVKAVWYEIENRFAPVRRKYQ